MECEEGKYEPLINPWDLMTFEMDDDDDGEDEDAPPSFVIDDDPLLSASPPPTMPVLTRELLDSPTPPPPDFNLNLSPMDDDDDHPLGRVNTHSHLDYQQQTEEEEEERTEMCSEPLTPPPQPPLPSPLPPEPEGEGQTVAKNGMEAKVEIRFQALVQHLDILEPVVVEVKGNKSDSSESSRSLEEIVISACEAFKESVASASTFGWDHSLPQFNRDKYLSSLRNNPFVRELTPNQIQEESVMHPSSFLEFKMEVESDEEDESEGSLRLEESEWEEEIYDDDMDDAGSYYSESDYVLSNDDDDDEDYEGGASSPPPKELKVGPPQNPPPPPHRPSLKSLNGNQMMLLKPKGKDTGSPVHRCIICNIVVTRRPTLWKHYRTHHDLQNRDPAKAHQCNKPACVAFFLLKSQLKKHQEVAHTHNNNSKLVEEKKPVVMMLKKVTTTTQWRLHQVSRHQQQRPQQLGSINVNPQHQHQCRICKHRVTTVFNLRRHYQDQHGVRNRDSVRCSAAGCSAHFRTQAQLKLHKRREHDEVETQTMEVEVDGEEGSAVFKCNRSNCSSRFGSQSDLGLHLERVHGRWCNLCGKEFTVPNHLRKHRYTVHKDQLDLRWGCGVADCGRWFEFEEEVKWHYQVRHKGETYYYNNHHEVEDEDDSDPVPSPSSKNATTTPQYWCSICNVGVTRPTQLRKHLMTHHGLQNGDPTIVTDEVVHHYCSKDNCSAYFLLKTQLQKHLEMSHGGEALEDKMELALRRQQELKKMRGGAKKSKQPPQPRRHPHQVIQHVEEEEEPLPILPKTGRMSSSSIPESASGSEEDAEEEEQEPPSEDEEWEPTKRSKNARSYSWRPSSRRVKLGHHHQCRLCKLKLSSISNLRRHYRFQHGVRNRDSIRCDVAGGGCTAYFRTQNQLKHHKMRSHQETSQVPPPPPLTPPPPPPPAQKIPIPKNALRCRRKNCTSWFTTLAELELHEEQLHGRWCNLCEKGFGSPNQLRKHRYRLHRPQLILRFACGVVGCGKKFEHEEEVWWHKQVWHKELLHSAGGSGGAGAGGGGATTTTSTSEEGRRGKFKCRICKLVFTRTDTLQRHQNTHHSLQNDSAQVLHCGMGQCRAYFLLQTQLTKHHELFHRSNSTKANRDYDFFSSGRQPQSLGGGGKGRHLCRICKLRISTRKNLKRHVQRQHGVPKSDSSCVPCDVAHCAAYFRTQTQLRTHKLRAHPGSRMFAAPPPPAPPQIIKEEPLDDDVGGDDDDDDDDDEEPIIPPILDNNMNTLEEETTTKKVEWRKQEEEKEDDKVAEGGGNGGGRKVVKCNLNNCSSTFASRAELLLHRKRLHGTTCLHCGAKFGTPNNLRRHRYRVHRDELALRFGCGVAACGKQFEYEEELKWHHQAAHPKKPFQKLELIIAPTPPNRVPNSGRTGKKSSPGHHHHHLRCEQCGKRFRDRAGLSLHLRVHAGPGSWKWACSLCGLKCTSKYKLERHWRTHTGEKPFGCPACGVSFARKDALKNHLWTKHPEEAEQTRG